MPERAHAAIRAVLGDTPDTVVRFVDALTVDTYFLREDRAGLVLFVNPVHQELVDLLRGSD